MGCQRLEMQYLHRQIEESDKLILRIANELEPSRRLVAIPEIGPVIATATIATANRPEADAMTQYRWLSTPGRDLSLAAFYSPKRSRANCISV